MSLLYIFLCLIMVADCIVLILLVLLQLPKKEAGAGMAFGGGATDALFGAGSGNVLTKITKYAAGIFFGVAIIMAMVASQNRKSSGVESLGQALGQHPTTPAGSPIPAPVPAAAPTPTGSGGLLQTPLLSNLPPAQSTSPAPATTAPAAPPATNK